VNSVRKLTRRERILGWIIRMLDNKRESIADKQWSKTGKELGKYGS